MNSPWASLHGSVTSLPFTMHTWPGRGLKVTTPHWFSISQLAPPSRTGSTNTNQKQSSCKPWISSENVLTWTFWLQKVRLPIWGSSGPLPWGPILVNPSWGQTITDPSVLQYYKTLTRLQGVPPSKENNVSEKHFCSVDNQLQSHHISLVYFHSLHPAWVSKRDGDRACLQLQLSPWIKGLCLCKSSSRHWVPRWLRGVGVGRGLSVSLSLKEGGRGRGLLK